MHNKQEIKGYLLALTDMVDELKFMYEDDDLIFKIAAKIKEYFELQAQEEELKIFEQLKLEIKQKLHNEVAQEKCERCGKDVKWNESHICVYCNPNWITTHI